ncbi:MAG: BrnT family toxin [Selenomonadaceae bacterium]|nr:BrnT family toxin [Selenomonadaceae bacterium]
MDINFNLGDLKFVWDSEKAEKNWKKHKVKFENAALVFLDEYRIENYDDFNSDDEDRFKIVGEVEKILVVIYTEREDKTRIISARQATKFEREEYYEQFSFV